MFYPCDQPYAFLMYIWLWNTNTYTHQYFWYLDSWMFTLFSYLNIFFQKLHGMEILYMWRALMWSLILTYWPSFPQIILSVFLCIPSFLIVWPLAEGGGTNPNFLWPGWFQLPFFITNHPTIFFFTKNTVWPPLPGVWKNGPPLIRQKNENHYRGSFDCLNVSFWCTDCNAKKP